MRLGVIILALGQIGLATIVLYMAFTTESDAAGEGMARGFALVGMTAVILFNAPALLLASIDKFLKAALVLALVCPLLGAWAVFDGVL